MKEPIKKCAVGNIGPRAQQISLSLNGSDRFFVVVVVVVVFLFVCFFAASTLSNIIMITRCCCCLLLLLLLLVLLPLLSLSLKRLLASGVGMV